MKRPKAFDRKMSLYFLLLFHNNVVNTKVNAMMNDKLEGKRGQNIERCVLRFFSFKEYQSKN